jgi:hypothetical protein
VLRHAVDVGQAAGPAARDRRDFNALYAGGQTLIAVPAGKQDNARKKGVTRMDLQDPSFAVCRSILGLSLPASTALASVVARGGGSSAHPTEASLARGYLLGRKRR